MISIVLTNGFGNNLFQFIAAKQLADFHKSEISVICDSKYYGIEELKKLGFKFKVGKVTGTEYGCNDKNYFSFFNKKFTGKNIKLSGYFEDYRYFVENIGGIKGWLPKIENKNTEDLVFHFRGGDRLLHLSTFDWKVPINNFVKAIEKFNFNKLYIVTDMPSWKHITCDDLDKMSFHINVEKSKRVETQKSVDYFNSFVDALSKYSPIHQRKSVSEDFSFIRSFDNILFEQGTLSWWAAATSNAKKVGVYAPWRPWKGKSNKNLSKIPLDGWFGWE
tara:strand:+ start:99 stop:926 length:828 start_codon:yes stop_codon:yes gene_type:complete